MAQEVGLLEAQRVADRAQQAAHAVGGEVVQAPQFGVSQQRLVHQVGVGEVPGAEARAHALLQTKPQPVETAGEAERWTTNVRWDEPIRVLTEKVGVGTSLGKGKGQMSCRNMYVDAAPASDRVQPQRQRAQAAQGVVKAADRRADHL